MLSNSNTNFDELINKIIKIINNKNPNEIINKVLFASNVIIFVGGLFTFNFLYNNFFITNKLIQDNNEYDNKNNKNNIANINENYKFTNKFFREMDYVYNFLNKIDIKIDVIAQKIDLIKINENNNNEIIDIIQKIQKKNIDINDVLLSLLNFNSNLMSDNNIIIKYLRNIDTQISNNNSPVDICDMSYLIEDSPNNFNEKSDPRNSDSDIDRNDYNTHQVIDDFDMISI
jgi:hypothetical protein